MFEINSLRDKVQNKRFVQIKMTMLWIKRQLKDFFVNWFSVVLIVANFCMVVWNHFFKPRVPGFVYDYYEEPTYFRIYSSLTKIPDVIAGWLFYPIDHFFQLDQHLRWQSGIFYLIFILFSSIQWAIVGWLLSKLWNYFIQSRHDYTL